MAKTKPRGVTALYARHVFVRFNRRNGLVEAATYRLFRQLERNNESNSTAAAVQVEKNLQWSLANICILKINVNVTRYSIRIGFIRNEHHNVSFYVFLR